MKTPLILVVGATGTIGREVVKELVARGQSVRALVRDRTKGENLGPNVEVTVGDLTKPDSLERAFTGVERAFVLAPGPTPELESNAFVAAKSAGVKHVVKLSGRGIESYIAGTFIAMGHLQAEAVLHNTGIPWSIIRPGFFASNFLKDFPVVAMGGARVPAGEGRDCPIDPRDVAAVVAKVLTTPGHEGRTYELTGPELLTYREMMRKISTAVGLPLEYTNIPEAEFEAMLLGAGAPAPFVRAVVQTYAAIRHGQITVSPDFASLMGRLPRSFDEWAADHAEALRGSAPTFA